MQSVGLYSLIVRPTRITNHSATVIDNIFTSLKSDKMVDDLSDHLPILTTQLMFRYLNNLLIRIERKTKNSTVHEIFVIY